MSNGYLCTITIDDVVPDEERGGYLVKGMSRVLRRKERERLDKEFEEIKDDCDENEVLKVITVIATVDGQEYLESRMVRCKPDISVDDVNIVVANRDDKPKITITLLK